MNETITFFDFEISNGNQKIKDIGAIKNGQMFHSGNIHSFIEFIKDSKYLCGHNIVEHDYTYIKTFIEGENLHPNLIDTLYLSPLLFPKRPYHKLLKDDKIVSTELNNPYNDAVKVEHLLNDEIAAYKNLPANIKHIYCTLLYEKNGFNGFFKLLQCKPLKSIINIIHKEFDNLICENANLDYFIKNFPIELAYSLALIYIQDKHSIPPAWISHHFPKVEYVIKKLCSTRCPKGCHYCRKHLNINEKLKQFFGYDNFRIYGGEPLQERAVQAAVDGKSLLAIFPTGGGKSLTFQLPALIAGENAHSLTVVISPLVSLMKDQVDNLISKDIYEAVTINGLLNSLERKEAIERIENGSASILYISPEALRSNTIEKILRSRHISRFVIDEAHCFSAWGQDFRVDYLYIGKFIKKLQENKKLTYNIPISCFTATAKQKVISDICDYFRKELGIELEIYASSSTRENLSYRVIHVDTDDERYRILRQQIQLKNCPTVVYVSRTRITHLLAERLTKDGFLTLPFNGKMDKEEKIENQNKFMKNECQIIVATSAFGMGIDKDNVGLVIHYEISESLENYVQEAGRAGRDPKQKADCIILFNDNDLDKHFELFNQTKLSINEIQQVWHAIKNFTKTRQFITKSPLEIARAAGWDDNIIDAETRVKAAIAELERAGFIERENNSPKVYATGIKVKSMADASLLIEQSPYFDEKEKKLSKAIMRSLIAKKYRAKANNDDSESRVDYLADHLGIDMKDAVSYINRLREAKILDDSQDMQVFLKYSEINTAERCLKNLFLLEEFLIQNIDTISTETYKELNDKAIRSGIDKATVKDIKSILYFWINKKYISKEYDGNQNRIYYKIFASKMAIKTQLKQKQDIIKFILEFMYNRIKKISDPLNFSILELLTAYNSGDSLFASQQRATIDDIESCLLYLSKIQVLDIEGNFLVFYNSLQIKRIQKDNKTRYKKENYQILQDYYTQKMQQIHIVGEYANLMAKDYQQALTYVFDYFQLDYMLFIKKYFKGNRLGEIQKNITSKRYNKLFGGLSPIQRQIIDDNSSQYIVVTAGPGSGKTKVLVHKLASLLLLEDIKSEQLLMLTFSRSAAIEFKKRLIDLIGGAAYYVDIKTFYSYCFDLMGQIGSIEKSETVVRDTTKMIMEGNIEASKITKTVLVIDEAQDISEDEFLLIEALMKINENMRIIAVGDDDQNIYSFRKSSSQYMKSLVEDFNATNYEMLENYRSDELIVNLANHFAGSISKRMKQNNLISLSKNKGTVLLNKTISKHIDSAGLKTFYETYKEGSCCILTNTNDATYRIHQNLIEHGYRAKIIQENNYFTLNNLYELRCYLRKIKSTCKTQLITQDEWKECESAFIKHFKDSPFIEECKKLLWDFDKINKYKYISDLDVFLQESNFSDFITPENNTILVSTIHKAKGKEFDNVYLILEDYKKINDDEKRVIFVGMTRAKHFLSITYNNNIFDNLNTKEIKFTLDKKQYDEMNKIVIQFSLKDINLGHFKQMQVQEILKKPNYNYDIKIDEDGLSVQINEKYYKLIIFSKAMINKLNAFKQKRYNIVKAEISCFVYWTETEEQKEYLTALPILYLSRN